LHIKLLTRGIKCLLRIVRSTYRSCSSSQTPTE